MTWKNRGFLNSLLLNVFVTASQLLHMRYVTQIVSENRVALKFKFKWLPECALIWVQISSWLNFVPPWFLTQTRRTSISSDTKPLLILDLIRPHQSNHARAVISSTDCNYSQSDCNFIRRHLIIIQESHALSALSQTIAFLLQIHSSISRNSFFTAIISNYWGSFFLRSKS